MKSPASEAEMVAVQFEGATIYRDPETEGHWLPRGELRNLAERQLDAELPPVLYIDEDTMHHSGRFCPEDNLEMVEYEFAESGIKIEQCLSCKGVWVDAGELKKVMAHVHEHHEDMEPDPPVTHPTPTQRVLAFLYQTTEHPPWF